MTTDGRRRQPTVPYQLSRRTTLQPEQVLAGIAALEVPGIHVVARGSTHLVLAPEPPRWYGAGAAVAAGIVITLGVLVAASASVPLVALLPAALLPGLPLVVRHEPRLGVGAVEDPDVGCTRVTVSGDMWSALAVALHSHLAGLPAPGAAGTTPPTDADTAPPLETVASTTPEVPAGSAESAEE